MITNASYDMQFGTVGKVGTDGVHIKALCYNVLKVIKDMEQKNIWTA